MKTTVRVIQVIVGVLFIVSGLVKANDPVGLGYKMQEFFELWSEGFSKGSLLLTALDFLHSEALVLSVFMITLEVLLGVALLLGWKKKMVLWLLLVLTVFFTFLTGYAFLSGKFTNCGCFGDCLPITPLTSFLKDLALLLLILILFAGKRFISPVLSATARTVILLSSLLFCLGLQWYVLRSLPIADCLPFKKGNYLPAQMKPPPGAVPDSFAIRFVYEKGGKTFEFAPEDLPADFNTYKFVDRKQSLVRKGNAEAPIRGFTLTNEEKDSLSGNAVDATNSILAAPKAILLFSTNVANGSWIQEAKPMVEAARKKSIPVYVISPSFTEAQQAFTKAGIPGAKFYNTDFTLVRTVARTNPTILYLENGTVRQKWSKSGLSTAASFIESASSK